MTDGTQSAPQGSSRDLPKTKESEMAKPTYIQHVALHKLINGVNYGHPIAARTMQVLEREGWVRDGQVTEAGRIAYQQGMSPDYPEPRSIAHNANARTGVYLGELRDV